ncbi:MAG TPA: VWA domain-containing protein [Verrucomicrobiales bacterium]|jgi:Ca-activated chloride channel family protein|nr:VWA domain-containing protein [Verrucomicrobiales bacterium]
MNVSFLSSLFAAGTWDSLRRHLDDVIPQLNTFRFATPWVLWLLLLLPLWMLLRGRFGRAAAVQFSSGELLAAASRRKRSSPGRLMAGFRYLALALLIGALARPQVDKGLSEREALGINIMFNLDFSSTMTTRDFWLDSKRVSRIEAMKRVVIEFIKARPDDRIGAVFFDRGAALLSPLTLDHEWLTLQIDSQESSRGTAPGSGMIIAAEAMLSAKDQTKVMITVTDADQINEGPEPIEVAKAIAPMGIKNHVIQIVDNSMAYRYAASGEVLKEVTRITGGQFYKVSDYPALRKVYSQIDTLEKTAFKEKKQQSWRELMEWFAVPGAILLLLVIILERTVWRRLP